MVWFANLDLLDQAGLTLPDPSWNTADFAQYAKKLTNPTNKVFGTAVPVGAGHGGIQWSYNFSGHDWVDESRTKVIVNNPQVEAALNYWLELMFESRVAPAFDNALAAGTSFLTGHVAMQEQWSTYFLNLLSESQKGTRLRWAMIPYPKGPAAQKHFAQAHIWSIAKNNPQPERAWVLVEWLGSLEAEKVWAETQRTPPQVPDARLWETYFRLNDTAKQRELIQFVTGTVYGRNLARNFDYWPAYLETEAVWRAEVASVLRRNQSPKQALDRMAPRMQAILDEAQARLKR